MNVKPAIFIVLMIWLSQITEAQLHELNFINFSSNSGLSSNDINSIAKDRFGYMWFATEDGLNRFDGINFRVYVHNSLDTNSIGSDQLQTVCVDPQGNLWVGTNRTLSLYDRKRDCFHNYNITNGTAIRSICSDNAGHLWIGSYAGLIFFDPVTGHTKYYTADSTLPGHLLSNTVTVVYKDRRQRLWVGSNTGLYLYQPATDNFRRFAASPENPAGIDDNVIKAIVEDRDGHLWFGTLSGGLNMLGADGNHFYHFKYDKADIHSLSSNTIYSLALDDSGGLWVGTEEGLNIFNPHTGKAQRITGNDRNRYSLRGRVVRSLYIDRKGIYWVGTFQGGVNKYDKNLGFFNLVQYNRFDPRGLSSPKITSFVQGKNDDVYIGTDGGGLNLFHRKTGLCDHIHITGVNKNNELAILALERLGDNIWIGTFQHGVYVLNIRTNAVKHFSRGNGPRDLPGDDIFCIRKDRHGDLWLGINGNGICKYEHRTGVFQRFGSVVIDGNRSKLLSGGYIRAIEEDTRGNLILGTIGSGVALYDPVRNTCRIFNRANTNLPLDEAISLSVDSDGVIWAGTPSGGLCRLDYARHRFSNYSESQGLANAVIYKILRDDAGNLWVSTNRGISCFDTNSSTFKNYTAENGLQPSSFNLGAGLKLGTGELFFGGIEGFNYFRPDELANNKNVPGIVFTDLRIGGHSVVPEKDAAIKENISVAKEIRLDYKQNFSVDFVALDYTTPKEDRYMYHLDGFDKAWNQLGESRTAVFTNLYPGSYTLEVRAKNCNGAWITQAADIKIVVKPPFWLTGYAYACYILAAVLILWGIRRRGIRKLKIKFALEQERLQMKQMIEQERLEAERLHEFDQLKIKFLTNLSHELRTPISLIMGPIDKLQEKEADRERQAQFGMVRRNARRLLNLVNQLLDFRKLEDHESKLNCTEGDIVPFLQEAAESFTDIADRKQIAFTFKSELVHYHTSFDRDKIERIVFNLLGNAFKFTGKGGTVSLELKLANPSKELMIVISDTGIGMAAEERERVFDRFFQGATQASVMNQGSGIGLSITREFVRLHGGAIEVESVPGKGSTFTILLPLEAILAPENGISDQGITSEEAKASGEIEHPVIPAMDMLTVLLVEDNEDFRCYLKDSLKTFYRILEASDGKEGWHMAISRHPDVIVSDISMPNMDGIELSRKIKSDRRVSHIPIILLTALTERAYQLKGLETGASDYVTKPFNFEILNVKIRNLVLQNQLFKQTYSRRLSVETPVAEVQSDDERLVLKVTQYIEANLDNAQLSVEELCKHVYMSHASLYRKVLDLTGETPVEFVRSVRLNRAAELLEKSDMKVAEIGYAVGFTTPNYFTRAFRVKFHLSPSEYITSKRNTVG